MDISATALRAVTRSTDEVAGGMHAFVRGVETILGGATELAGNYLLDTVEVVEAVVSTEGKVRVLGAGAAATGSASLEIR